MFFIRKFQICSAGRQVIAIPLTLHRYYGKCIPSSFIKGSQFLLRISNHPIAAVLATTQASYCLAVLCVKNLIAHSQYLVHLATGIPGTILPCNVVAMGRFSGHNRVAKNANKQVEGKIWKIKD